MSELSIVIVNVIALAVAYLYLYPKFAGNDVKRLAWLDTGELVDFRNPFLHLN